ncbi:MAG: hypothetical protein ACI9EW_001181 [Cellvibrionaceae bacterium]|jgi:capsular polysaccharide biosynthesis protein
MQLPKTSNLLLPMLKLLSSNDEYHHSKIAKILAEKLEINKDDKSQDPTFNDKFYAQVLDAHSQLTHAKLIIGTKEEASIISTRGEALLAEKPKSLTTKSLKRYPEFVAYLQSNTSDSAEQTPETIAPLEPASSYTLSEDTLEGHSNPQDITASTEAAATESIYSEVTSPSSSEQHTSVVSKGHLQQHEVMIPQENFISTLELFENLQASRQLKPRVRNKPILVKEQVEGLSPALFAVLSLMRFLENMFQNIWLYSIPFFLMTIAYAASFFILSDEFVSKGVMFVHTDTLINEVSSLGQNNFSRFLSPSEQTAGEIRELLYTDSFVRLIIQDTPLESNMAAGDSVVQETLTNVRDAISINTTGNSNVEIRASWDDQEIAWKLAESTLNSFTEWKIESGKRDSFAAREFLERLVPQYENDQLAAVQNLQSYLIQNPEPFRGDRPEIEQLQIDQLRDLIQTADNRYQESSNDLEQIRLEEVILEGNIRQSYQIVDSPELATEEEGGVEKKIITGAVFVVLGIVLSLLAIILTTILDRSIRFPIESPSTLGLPVLSAVKAVPDIDALIIE